MTVFQLCSADDDINDGAVSILKATIFGTNHLAAGCSLTDSKQMNSVLPLLLNLLDERDGTARAVVTLIAEYCSMYAFKLPWCSIKVARWVGLAAWLTGQHGLIWVGLKNSIISLI